jgi:TRAP-type C4-dicarboxylate transport system permease small subunit
MSIVLGIALSFFIFYIMGSYIAWDLTYVTKMGEWDVENRVLYGMGLIGTAFSLTVFILAITDND